MKNDSTYYAENGQWNMSPRVLALHQKNGKYFYGIDFWLLKKTLCYRLSGLRLVKEDSE